MAATKLNFWVGVLFVSAMLMIGLLTFGNSLNQNPNIQLDNASIEYISNYEGYLDSEGISTLDDDDVVSYKQDSIINEENDTGEQGVTDFLANLNYYKNKANKILNPVKLVYNLPTLYLLGLNLPVGEFNNYINIIALIMYIVIVYMFIKIVRGS